MKLLTKFFFCLFFFILFTPSVAFAQEAEVFDFNKAYKDYVFTYDEYKKAHADYLLARAQYKEAQTLASQTKARDHTIVMLESRDEAVATYLTALRLRLSEAEGVSTTDREGLYTRLDSEIAWFRNHKDQVGSASTLDDLVAESDEAKEHFTTTEPLIYEVLAAIPIGKINAFRQRINQILADITTKTEEIRANGDHDTAITERWIIETEQKITRSLDKEIEAQKLVFTLQNPDPRKKTKSSDQSKIYTQIIALLTDSNQFLREASSFMREIVTQLKTAQS